MGGTASETRDKCWKIAPHVTLHARTLPSFAYRFHLAFATPVHPGNATESVVHMYGQSALETDMSL